MGHMELAERLRTALDETERVARDAGASFLGTSGRTWKRDGVSSVEDADGRLVVCGDGTPPTSAQADHIALHDPERELRMVAAHREIVEMYEAAVREADEDPNDPARSSDVVTLEAVLEVIADALQVEV